MAMKIHKKGLSPAINPAPHKKTATEKEEKGEEKAGKFKLFKKKFVGKTIKEK